MSIDEAIAHEKELAKKIYLQGMLCHANPDDEKLDGYIESGKYHEQISEWLEELKSYRSVGVPLLQHFNDIEIYNNAIDDFVVKLKTYFVIPHDVMVIEMFAEQLKEGK